MVNTLHVPIQTILKREVFLEMFTTGSDTVLQAVETDVVPATNSGSRWRSSPSASAFHREDQRKTRSPRGG